VADPSADADACEETASKSRGEFAEDCAGETPSDRAASDVVEEVTLHIAPADRRALAGPKDEAPVDPRRRGRPPPLAHP